MIIDLPSTTTEDISKKLVSLRNNVGAMATGRVLTLITVTSEDEFHGTLDVLTAATRQHPSRILVVIEGDTKGENRLDAQIRLGGDAGASEIVILRLFGKLANHGDAVVIPLLLSDMPIVAWWPGRAPEDVGSHPIGRMAQRRITDSAVGHEPTLELQRRHDHYCDGDTDLAWTRLTRWRGLLAAALDQPPFEPVTSATVTAAEDSPSGYLLAGWLEARLKCPVVRARARTGHGIIGVRLDRKSGPIDLVRPVEEDIAVLCAPDQPTRRITLAHRDEASCLADELARLDPDEIYHEALRAAMAADATTMTASQAVDKALAMSVDEARRRGDALLRDSQSVGSASMVEAAPEKASTSPTKVHAAAKKRLHDEAPDADQTASTTKDD